MVLVARESRNLPFLSNNNQKIGMKIWTENKHCHCKDMLSMALSHTVSKHSHVWL